MCESYARSLLRVSVAQICQALGWDAVQLTACDLLSDVLHRYIQQLARGCHRYSELYGRTDPMLDDVGQAFRLLGVNVSELEDYIHHLEPVEFPHQTPLFPVSKNNMLQFPQPGARDSEERKAYIPDYMPPLVSLQEEEEEEQVLPDMGTSAEAMQVPLDEEEEEDMDEEEAVNDENYLAKRRLDSPTSMGVVPAAKRPRLPGFRSPDSPDWGTEPREPLSSLNPQRVPAPAGVPPLHPHDGSGSQATSPGVADHIPTSRAQLPTPKIPITPGRKPKVGSPGRQRVKSPKRASSGGLPGSPARSPKASQKEKKKSPGKTKSPKSPKQGLIKAIPLQGKTDLTIKPLLPLSEKVEKENILLKPIESMVLESEKPPVEPPPRKLELPDNTIDDSIAAVIARACAERKPDPFAFSSGSESEGDGFSSPRRLTISEPMTQKLAVSVNSFGKDASTPLPQNVGATLTGNSWTMDDSINEVLRKVNQGCPSGTPPNPAYISSPSASPPTPEPLLKMYEEKNKLVVSTDIKKKLKKELKSKIKKREKEKQREKERDKGKSKEKSREKNKDKERELSKEARQPWKDLSSKEDEQRDLLKPRDISESDVPKMKSKDGGGSKKEKDKHKDKKKDKEKSRKDKEKRDKSKDKSKEDRQKSTASLLLGLKEAPLPLFSPAACLKLPPMLPPLPPILPDKAPQDKDKEKKKDKKEKKKKKDKDKEKDREKEKERAREKEREKEEKKKEKEKREKEKEKEKERHKLEKVKAEPPVPPPSPVIPRLTLRVGAGQDKIVISKVVPGSEAKTPIAKTPVAKTAPAKTPTPKTSTPKTTVTKAPSKSAPPARPRSPPPAPALLPPPAPMPATPLPPLPVSPAPAVPLGPIPVIGSFKTPVRSVVTETVSTYVIRDEWGNQIWICPGCNKPDDGSPMIGCDDCDDWYHWPCVGLLAAPPEDVQWFCVKCDSKRKDKKHKKRKHKVH
ncbi:transcription initiation factor TFIID subunit 3-like isoform X1 [Paramormyrops kingsleyae]|uniref:transcription initiation factor TFIID subunit 3-like isoform X1 n=2 Tax=Paramormyrops kingsleyae TaxID=1676925 RepID=UPI003B976FD8